MQKKITYIILLFVGIFIGFKACELFNQVKYQTEIQEFRNTKTSECLVKQRDGELKIN